MRKVYVRVRRFMDDMGSYHVGAYAASTAFFFFLSMVPILLLLCSILPLTPVTKGQLTGAITDLLPDVFDSTVSDLISHMYAKATGVLPLAIIALIWTAGKGIFSLMNGLNVMSGVPENRNYFFVRMLASFYTIVMLLVVLFSLIIMVFGGSLLDFLAVQFPAFRQIADWLIALRFFVIWLLLIVMFAAIYAYVPNKKLRFREQIPGAIFTSVVWSIFSFGFSIYVEFSNYSLYGSLAILIMLMLWMYFCMYIVLIGAYINNFFSKSRR